MPKIKKGLKKIIKGKKDKGKGEDLFDPANLEKYKKEIEEKKRQLAEEAEKGAEEGNEDNLDNNSHSSGPSHSKTATSHEDNEEWQKFKLLTSGVDELCKKSQGELVRIKTDSYFQRNTPKPEDPKTQTNDPKFNRQSKKKGKRWIDVEAAGEEGGEFGEEEFSDTELPHNNEWPENEEVNQSGNNQENLEEGAAEEEAAFQPELVEVEETIVIDDDLFDTTFVEAAEKGEIKLAYVPDSPVEEEFGDDLFDTDYAADIIKQIEEEEKRKKREVNLGGAVKLLSGKNEQLSPTEKKAAAPTAVSESKRKGRPRPTAVNLLGDFEGGCSLPAPEQIKTEISGEEENTLDVFDVLVLCESSTELKEGELSLGVIELVPKTIESVDNKKDTKEEKDENKLNLDLSEFETLGNFETSGKEEKLIDELVEEEEDDEFSALAAESIHKDKKEDPSSPTKEEEEEEEAVEEDEFDVFDTSFVTAPGKSELKVIESEILGENSSTENKKEVKGEDEDFFDFNPREGEFEIVSNNNNQISIQKDLLGGSTSDLSSKPVGLQPRPSDSENPDEADADPFNTENFENLVPGKYELKILEEELLNTDKDHQIEIKTHPILEQIKAASAKEDEFDEFDPRAGEEPAKLHPLDLIEEQGFEDIHNSNILLPSDDTDKESDPFDTSIASFVVLPSKLELKVLESELEISINSQEGEVYKPSLIDEDHQLEFDLRAGEEPKPVVEYRPKDIFELDHGGDFTITEALQPETKEQSLKKESEEFADPFDTEYLSIQKLLPGKGELKVLESELLSSQEDFKLPSLLPPKKEIPVQQPIQVQEVTQQQPQLPQTPSKHPPPSRPPPPHLLESLEDPVLSHQALSPVKVNGSIDASADIDPFDTSIAETILPTKTELKYLEADLGLGCEPSSSSSVNFSNNTNFTDQDFDPRGTGPVPIKPLVPKSVSKIESEETEIDPFDTSNIGESLGKTELRILEAEFL